LYYIYTDIEDGFLFFINSSESMYELQLQCEVIVSSHLGLCLDFCVSLWGWNMILSSVFQFRHHWYSRFCFLAHLALYFPLCSVVDIELVRICWVHL